MTKLLPSLALAVALVGGAAAPALADTSFDSFDEAYQVQRLHDAGVKAVAAAEDTSTTMRATVVLDNGQKVFQYYSTDSLQPIGSHGGATRVLSKLDVREPGQAKFVSNDSLLRDTWTESK